MSAAPFITILTPLTAVPIVFGLALGVWDCLSIVADAYGLDLAIAVPWVHHDQGGVGGPLLLFGVAAFALARGRQIRGRRSADGGIAGAIGSLSWLDHACLAGTGLGVATIPYWLQFPVPEAWLTVIVVLSWIGWRTISR